jgi:hypothetical protein
MVFPNYILCTEELRDLSNSILVKETSDKERAREVEERRGKEQKLTIF